MATKDKKTVKSKKNTAPKKEKSKNTQIKNMAELLYKRTVEWGAEYELYPKGEKIKKIKKKSKYSDKAIKLDKLIANAGFDCREPHVRKIISEVINEKLPESKSKINNITYKHGIVLVPLSDPVGNEFELGKPRLVKDEKGRTVSMKGEQSSNYFSNTHITSIRIANKIEIEELLKSLIEIDDFGLLMSGFFLANLNPGGK